ncbi:EAL domain-containing protein [Deefgea sp. CFH1-16]|nr:EAL domain-containing protein [Deefgea sp. CFH1-16]MBM5574663.1 EAL domain-containing protein [Deefgea sp. CFH1-16]
MYIANALEVWDIPANTLVLEITESALIADIEAALKQLEQLKQMGCLLSLDDFGTGYSSLSYLKRLPIDELKIDRSFIQSMGSSDKDAPPLCKVLSNWPIVCSSAWSPKALKTPPAPHFYSSINATQYKAFTTAAPSHWRTLKPTSNIWSKPHDELATTPLGQPPWCR